MKAISKLDPKNKILKKKSQSHLCIYLNVPHLFIHYILFSNINRWSDWLINDVTRETGATHSLVRIINDNNHVIYYITI
jgi:hypothetical protein